MYQGIATGLDAVPSLIAGLTKGLIGFPGLIAGPDLAKGQCSVQQLFHKELQS